MRIESETEIEKLTQERRAKEERKEKRPIKINSEQWTKWQEEHIYW